MKIAMFSLGNAYADLLAQKLKAKSTHELVQWKQGDAAPATDFNGVITSFGKVTREMLAGQTKLGFVQTASAGYDAVDVDAATELGIWVSYAPSGKTGNAASVAEHAILLMLAVSRDLSRATTWSEGETTKKPFEGFGLRGKTVCIIGYGGIGHELVARLRPFGVKLLAVNRRTDAVPEGVEAFAPEQRNEALAQADYVVLCVPATPANKNMANAEFFKTMKQGAYLINIARGALVDEAALLDSINAGHLAGAGLDVLHKEPIEAANPLVQSPKVIVTPHIAGLTDVTLEGTVAFLAGALDAYARGEKVKSVVNAPEKPRLVLS